MEIREGVTVGPRIGLCFCRRQTVVDNTETEKIWHEQEKALGCLGADLCGMTLERGGAENLWSGWLILPPGDKGKGIKGLWMLQLCALLLLFVVTVQVTGTNHTYWAYFSNPPIHRRVTWGDMDIPAVVNEVLFATWSLWPQRTC